MATKQASEKVEWSMTVAEFSKVAQPDMTAINAMCRPSTFSNPERGIAPSVVLFAEVVYSILSDYDELRLDGIESRWSGSNITLSLTIGKLKELAGLLILANPSLHDFIVALQDRRSR